MSTRHIPTSLVAGGAGFIGSHLCAYLLGLGHRVVCVDNLMTGTTANLSEFAADPCFSFIEHDIIAPLPGGLRADYVFNLACAASPPLYQRDPIHTMMTNVVGTNQLLAFAAQQGARLLQASTSEIYGDPQVHPQPESYLGNVNPIGPRACYDEGKRAAETLCFDYKRMSLADVRVARIFNTYGPRLRPTDGRVISNMVSQALAGDSLTIYGDGSQTRSFCYIDDLVRGLAILMLHDKAPQRPVNFGNPAEITIAEIAVIIRRLTGSSSLIVFRPLPVDDPQRRRPDITTAQNILGWNPRIGLEQGLKQTIAWFSGELEQEYMPPAHVLQHAGRLHGLSSPSGE